MSRRTCALLLLSLLPASAARAGDGDKDEWIRRQDDAQFNRSEGSGGNIISTARARDPKSSWLNYNGSPIARVGQGQPPGPAQEGVSRAGAPGAEASWNAGSAGSSGSGGSPAGPGAAGESAQAHEAAALSKAASMASQLKAAGPDAAALGPAPKAPSRGETPRAGAYPRRLLPAMELIATERPYNASFKSAGLRVGTGLEGRAAIVDASSGRPATPAQLEALRRNIAAEPRALMRRPDLYQVISREDFQRLKGVYVAREGSGDRRFQDIGLTEPPRDFVWTRSCREVSGSCNPLAHEKSYDKGAEVSPETLAGVAKAIKESQQDDDDDGLWNDYVRYQKTRIDADASGRSAGLTWGRGAAALSGRLRALLGALGWGSGGSDETAGAGSSLESLAGVSDARAGSGQTGAADPAAAARGDGALSAVSASVGAKGGLLVAALGALVAVGALICALRRKEET